jgi:transcriptional regulator with XRE-family HTH domain
MPKTKPEHQRAREWRERMGLTLRELGELTGYGLKTVWWMEQGRSSRGEPTKPWVMQRYRLACAAVERKLVAQEEFDW